jgi:hypothetical protein
LGRDRSLSVGDARPLYLSSMHAMPEASENSSTSDRCPEKGRIRSATSLVSCSSARIDRASGTAMACVMRMRKRCTVCAEFRELDCAGERCDPVAAVKGPLRHFTDAARKDCEL